MAYYKIFCDDVPSTPYFAGFLFHINGHSLGWGVATKDKLPVIFWPIDKYNDT